MRKWKKLLRITPKPANNITNNIPVYIQSPFFPILSKHLKRMSRELPSNNAIRIGSSNRITGDKISANTWLCAVTIVPASINTIKNKVNAITALYRFNCNFILKVCISFYSRILYLYDLFFS